MSRKVVFGFPCVTNNVKANQIIRHILFHAGSNLSNKKHLLKTIVWLSDLAFKRSDRVNCGQLAWIWLRLGKIASLEIFNNYYDNFEKYDMYKCMELGILEK